MSTNNSVFPSIISSLLVGMIAYKVYSTTSETRENFENVKLPKKGTNSVQYTGDSDSTKGDFNLISSPSSSSGSGGTVYKQEPIPLPKIEGAPDPQQLDINFSLPKIGYRNLVSRNRSLGDPIRGDLSISSTYPCEMFRSVHTHPDNLHPGAMKHLV
jgi:hypothetical protein